MSGGGGDRHVRVWHNHPGRRVLLEEMKAELPKATSDALKVRERERELPVPTVIIVSLCSFLQRRLQTQIEEIR